MSSKRGRRANLIRKQRGKCKYCGCRVNKATATLDHVVPRSAGGTMAMHNLVVACRACNQKKANKPPHVWHMELMTEKAA